MTIEIDFHGKRLAGHGRRAWTWSRASALGVPGGGEPRGVAPAPRPPQADRQRPDRSCPRELNVVFHSATTREDFTMDADLADLEFGASSMAELLTSLGGISPERVRMKPAPRYCNCGGCGTATQQNPPLVRTRGRHSRGENHGCPGIVRRGRSAIADQKLEPREWQPRNDVSSGRTVQADGALVRMPDVSFTSWDRIPGRQVPTTPVLNFALDLAVEVLSEGNTPRRDGRQTEGVFPLRSPTRLVRRPAKEDRAGLYFTGRRRRTRRIRHTRRRRRTAGVLRAGVESLRPTRTRREAETNQAPTAERSPRSGSSPCPRARPGGCQSR